MKSMIKELWHGNIIPQEDSRTNSNEMKKLPRIHGKASRRLGRTSRKKYSKSSTIAGVST